MDEASLKRRGMLIAVAGVVSVTPDAVLVRWASQLGASPPAIIFFKLVWVFSFVMSWVAITEGWTLTKGLRYRGGIRYFVAIMLLQASIDLFFPLAFMLTYAANVLVLYSLQPVWSAVLGWFLLGDPLPRRTMFALFGALTSVFVMFLPRIMGDEGEDDGSNNDLGMCIAIWLGFAMSCFVVVTRRACQKVPDLPISFATALGALLGAATITAISESTGGSVLKGISPLFFLVTAIDGACVGGVFIAFSIAPRYISGVQIGLLSLLEAILGPVWVLIIYNEQPPFFTLLGGLIMIVTVASHEYSGLRAERAYNKGNDSRSSSAPTTAAANVVVATGVELTNRKDHHEQTDSGSYYDDYRSAEPFSSSSDFNAL